MFKGTTTRSAREIAEVIDAAGGQMNAYTSKEHTCYYARVLDAHLGLAVEILADMLRRSVFAPAEIEKEKGVILEEIKMYEDSPDEMVHDLLAEAAFGDHPLGRSVLGRSETVRGISRGDVVHYLEEKYDGSNLVVAAAGRVDHDQLVESIIREFGNLPRGADNLESQPLSGPGRHLIYPKETEQVHLCVGAFSLQRNHEDRFALHLLDVALGGGMSSRFFQDLREERGLVYSTYSYHSSFYETGLFSVYAGTSPENAKIVLDLILDGLSRAATDGFHPDEVSRAKEQLKGSLMLGLEHTANRMSRIARAELFHEELLSPDELCARIDAVTMDDLQRVSMQILGGAPIIAAVGPVDQSLTAHIKGDVKVMMG